MKRILLFTTTFFAAHAMDQESSITKKETYSFKDSFDEHKDGITHLMFNPTDSNELISNSYDSTIKIWDISKKLCTRTFNKENKGYSFALSHDGNFIAYGDRNNNISIINKATCTIQKIVGPQYDRTDLIKKIRFHPKNSSCLISCLGSEERQEHQKRQEHQVQNIITIFDTQSNKKATIIAYLVYDLQIEPIEGKNIIVGSEISSKVYDIETLQLIHESHGTCGSEKIIFNPQTPKECLFYDGQDSHAQIYDTTNNNLIRSFHLKYNGKQASLNNITFHPNGKELIATTLEQTYIFDALTGNYIESLPNEKTFLGVIAQKINKKSVKNGIHTEKMLGSIGSPDGTIIATHSLDNKIKIWQKKSN